MYPFASCAVSIAKAPHPEGLCLRKAAIVSIFATVAPLCCASLHGQESLRLDAVHSLGVSTTYSPTSTHILIGDSEQRRIWSFGVEYSRLLERSRLFRFDYEGSILPVYEETDPTITGTTFTLGGQSVNSPQTPMRIVYAVRGPVGTLKTPGGGSTPIFATTGRENTYAAAFSPLGVRISALPRSMLQPSFAFDLGFVLSARDIPIDQSSQFNFMFSFGPGVQLFNSPETAIRLEYLYRHTSNAGLGDQNPGVDQGVTRITVSRRW
jgi:Lipid A 3-O-deacylase (PagL)